MDLVEHGLTEAQRRLKRLGITHVLRKNPPEPIRGATTRPDRKPCAPAAKPRETAAPDTATISKNNRISNDCTKNCTSFPRLYTALFHGKHLPVHAVWTYPELSRDLQAVHVPERLAMLRTILGVSCSRLAWPEQRHILWPCLPDLETFRRGLERLQPNIVFFFGERTGFGPPPTPQNALAPFLYGRVMIQPLPSLDTMCANDQNSKNLAWKILCALRPEDCQEPCTSPTGTVRI